MQKKRKAICRLSRHISGERHCMQSGRLARATKAVGILPCLLTTGTISRDMEMSRQTRFKNYTYVNLEKMIHIPPD